MPLAPDERKLITSEKLKQKYSNKQAAAKVPSNEPEIEDPVVGENVVESEPVVTHEPNEEIEDTSNGALDLLRQKLQVGSHIFVYGYNLNPMHSLRF